jgi:opacity protein-like surface antigen
MRYEFKSNSPWGNQTESIIKTGEKQNFSYTVGAKAEYNLSSRFAVSLGIAYQVFSFNSKPGIIYAQKSSDGDVGYYFTTSSGVVECPSYYGTPSVGDSIKMSAASTRTYLEIPVRLKYNFVDKEKIKLYFIAGVDANICLAEKTTMNWQDFWNESGIANINETEGSEKVYMSCYLGIGVNYKICNNLSLYLEPGMHRAITALDNNTSPVVTYPQLFSATAGITYQIK